MKKKLPISFKLFAVSNILMFISIFLGAAYSPKITGVGVILWVLTLVWTLNDVLKVVNFKVSDFTDELVRIGDEAYEEKKRFKGTVHFLAAPFMGAGVAVIVVSISAFFIM